MKKKGANRTKVIYDKLTREVNNGKRYKNRRD